MISSLFRRRCNGIPSGAYYLQFTDPINKKRRCVSLKTTDYREAKEKQRSLTGAICAQSWHPTTETLFEPFMKELSERWRVSLRETTYANNMKALRRVFGPCHPVFENSTDKRLEAKGLVAPIPSTCLRCEKLEDLTVQQCAAYLHNLRDKEHLHPKTVNLYRGVMVAMFKEARKFGYRCPVSELKHPLEEIKPCKLPEPDIIYLNRNEIGRQLTALNEYPRLRAMVSVYIYAGLRREEAVWLTRDDIDLTTGTKLIYVRAKSDGPKRWQTKTGRDREVPISDKLHVELVQYLKGYSGHWLFPSATGGRWTAAGVSSALGYVNQRNGLTWNCAQFRHTFATLIVQAQIRESGNVDMTALSILMGNSPAVCLRWYAKFVPKDMHRIVNLI